MQAGEPPCHCAPGQAASELSPGWAGAYSCTRWGGGGWGSILLSSSCWSGACSWQLQQQRALLWLPRGAAGCGHSQGLCCPVTAAAAAQHPPWAHCEGALHAPLCSRGCRGCRRCCCWHPHPPPAPHSGSHLSPQQWRHCAAVHLPLPLHHYAHAHAPAHHPTPTPSHPGQYSWRCGLHCAPAAAAQAAPHCSSWHAPRLCLPSGAPGCAVQPAAQCGGQPEGSQRGGGGGCGGWQEGGGGGASCSSSCCSCSCSSSAQPNPLRPCCCLCLCLCLHPCCLRPLLSWPHWRV